MREQTTIYYAQRYPDHTPWSGFYLAGILLVSAVRAPIGGLSNTRKVENAMIESILRGNLYYADLNPVVGSEQGGYRPVLVIQNDVGNKHSPTVIVAAITGKEEQTPLPTHCILAPEAENGLDRESIVLLEQIRTIDKRRLKAFVGTLGEDIMWKIDRALAVSVGLEGMAGC
jgi:mRNA interferase MazF